MGTARIIIDIAVNAQRAAADVTSAAGSMDSLRSSVGQLAVPAGIAVAAIVAVGKSAADSASTTQQAMGAVDSVFGASAAKVKDWAAGSAEAVGLSTSAYGQLASVAGASLKSMGLSTDQAADATGNMITLGADLAATFGGTTADAVSALTSALRGEADPAERLGLKLNQTTVAARMAADGTDKLTGTALDAAKAQTIMALATEQAAGANGQFARESGTAAGAQEIANAQFENAKSAMGESLLPVVTALSEAMGTLAQWVSENTGLVTGIVVAVLALAAGVLAVNAALAVASAAQAVWNGLQLVGKAATAAYTAAQWLFNAAMTANPIGLVIVAVVALIAGFVLLWTKCDGFRQFFIDMANTISAVWATAWGAIKSAASAVLDWIKSAASAVGSFISGVWDGIKSAAATAWDAIRAIVSPVIDAIKSALQTLGSIASGIWNGMKTAVDAVKRAIDAVISAIRSAISWASNLASKIPFIGGIFGQSAAPAGQGVRVTAAPSLSRFGASSRAVAGGGGGPTIVVQGALDPVAVARQIRALLVAQDRRTGGTRT